MPEGDPSSGCFCNIWNIVPASLNGAFWAYSLKCYINKIITELLKNENDLNFLLTIDLGGVIIDNGK